MRRPSFKPSNMQPYFESVPHDDFMRLLHGPPLGHSVTETG